MKTYIKLLFVFLLSAKLVAQTDSEKFRIAEDLVENERYSEALPYYMDLLKRDSSNANLNFRIGICYLNSRSQKVKAVYFLNKAIAPTTSFYVDGARVTAQNPIVAQQYLGSSSLSYNFEEINQSCEKFKSIVSEVKGKELSVIEVLNLKMELNEIVKSLDEFNASPINFKIETADKNKNVSYVKYSSVLSTDCSSVVFNFQKPGSKWEENNEESVFFEDDAMPVFLFKNDTSFQDQDSIKRKVSTSSLYAIPVDSVSYPNGSEATVATSEDNQVVLTYRDEKGEGNLYMSRLANNKWTMPEKLIKPINKKGWESNEFISADGNWLYFTSDRKGGFGGIDVYRSRKMPNGEWSKASNLGPGINTQDDDRAPVVLPDGTTLYFSTNGHSLVKRFEVFMCTISEDGKWSVPVNVGYPINVTTEGLTSSLTSGSINLVSSPGKESLSDVNGSYLVTFINKNKKNIHIINGRLLDSVGAALGVIKIRVTNNETEEVTDFYARDSKTGLYSFVLPSGKNQSIIYATEGCLFQSENIDLRKPLASYENPKEIQMPPIARGSRVVLKNVVFDSTKTGLHSVSNTELNTVLQLLNANPNLIVEISSYMISAKNGKSNKAVAAQRAQLVMNYLLKMGISEGRLNARGYTKYKNPTVNKKFKDGSTNRSFPQQEEWMELRVIAHKKNV